MVESALRFADEQKLGEVRCFLEGKTRREGKARRLTGVSQCLGQGLRLREREPNIAISLTAAALRSWRRRNDFLPTAEVDGLDFSLICYAALTGKLRFAQKKQDEVRP